MRSRIRALLAIVSILLGLSGVFVTNAHALDIPTLTWERGVEQHITLGGNTGGGAWQIYLTGSQGSLLPFSSKKYANSSFYDYKIRIPESLPVGNYDVLVSRTTTGSAASLVEHSVVSHVRIIVPTTYVFTQDSNSGWLVAAELIFLALILLRYKNTSMKYLRLKKRFEQPLIWLGLSLGLLAGAYGVHQGELIVHSIGISIFFLTLSFISVRASLFGAFGYSLVEFAFGKVHVFQNATAILLFVASWLIPALLLQILRSSDDVRALNNQSERTLSTYRPALITILSTFALPNLFNAAGGAKTSLSTSAYWALTVLLVVLLRPFIFRLSQAFDLQDRFLISAGALKSSNVIWPTAFGYLAYELSHSLAFGIASGVVATVMLLLSSRFEGTAISGLTREGFIILSLPLVGVWSFLTLYLIGGIRATSVLEMILEGIMISLPLTLGLIKPGEEIKEGSQHV